MASNVENTKKTSKLSKKDITMLGIRSSLLQSAFSYERMQAGGWAFAQVPIWKKIFGNDKKALSEAMSDNMEFINTAPPLVSILMGLLTSLEEKRVDRQTIRGLKNGLFGPMAGIGDAIYWFTLMPIVGGIAASFASKGNILGPIIFFLVYLAIFLCRIPFAHLGYNLGVKAIDVIQDNSKIIARVATIMGLTVIGALISQYVALSLSVKIGSVSLQKDFLDKIFPNILPLGFTFFLYYLLKKKVSPIVLIVIVFVLCIICSYFKIM
ncbi:MULTISPECIES: PTS galactosamine transporter subunit IID [Pediococcus]|uniref:PTS system D-galactosamine-specific EIID component, Man family n=1 Tax=Pediococcus pentosaceus (strain ATCC 25745 / CCUG 21536 / LMG 10740 / 183-1w) TaxID=278197 RepID=Q03HP2_PEDPA|nr:MULTISPECIES: PTS galactosamine transporter subunit IID [Pediococcus]ABJ67280.1 PTS system D-galactosamine-specific EIID component, Man family [Pediococcus pentosaceus ATCC 25745]MDD1388448.1 PTS galactosamine transporter subunit IID [Pediococcus pentosaceus]QHM65175.1 PTS system mannose-specific EIID component [Pediococcus pentosaceus]QHM66894.1 PTS system mannose-specific EIID component [Pediococcus pentosaceus]QHM68952.1 PTS system mannose-specific EIID component [Pediococcus pentosaceus